MMSKAVFGGGCFWGVEELIRSQSGVVDTEVGYSGGTNDNPTYDYHPGHAEVVEVKYDEQETTYERLLDFFFTIHDPTTLNQQGNDTGESYRSVVFYESDEQLEAAKKIKELVGRSGKWTRPVVTEIVPLAKFYPAESEHQDYLRRNPGGYTCHFQRFESYIKE